MNGAAYGAVLAAGYCAPLLLFCAIADGVLGRRDGALRRQVWILCIGAALLVTAVTVTGSSIASRPAGYWETRATAAGEPLAGPLDDGGRALRAALPELLRPLPPRRDPAPGHGTASLWVLVLALLLVRQGFAQRQVRRYVAHAAAVDDDGLRADVLALATELGLRRAVTVRWHHETVSSAAPAVAGLVVPTVLLPRAATGWTAAERRCVLLHELAHVLRRDNLWRAAAWLLCAVQWFNPLAWWALRRLHDSSEMAADDFAARRAGRADDYAAALVTVTRSLLRPGLPLASMADAGLARRVRRLLDPGSAVGRAARATLLTALSLTAAAALSTGLLAHAGRDRLRGWEPQQYRWESDRTANGVFVHGELDLEPGALRIGREGLLVAVHEPAPGSLETCLVWRAPTAGARFQCDAPLEPQRWLDARLREAAGQWRFDAEAPLASYWNGRAANRFSGSRIVGIPGSSRNPQRRIVQSGWIDDAGERVGVLRRAGAFALAFRYAPLSGELRALRELAGGGVERWSGSGWTSASPSESEWFRSALADASPPSRGGTGDR
jgi:hypothetical protein